MPGEPNQIKWVGTRKVDPAIADLQAVESFIRAYDTTVCTAGNNTASLYTVPAGKIFVQQFMGFTCDNAAPATIQCYMDDGTNLYYWNVLNYGGAWSIVTETTLLMFEPTEIVKATWTACGAGNTIYSWACGYLIDQY